MARLELGHAGHFIGAPNCQFRRHTHTREHCVSTVGLWMSDTDVTPREIGLGRLYETMVFRLRVGEEVSQGSLDNETHHQFGWFGCSDCPQGGDDVVEFRAYNDATAANEGHEEIVRLIEERE